MKNPYPRTKAASLLLATFFALASVALAVDPPPDGGYPNGNTAEGEDALFSVTTGRDNTALGFHALYDNSLGSRNTAAGTSALSSNTIAKDNTADGFGALNSNTEGDANTAVGAYALNTNTIGQWNTAAGYQALRLNTTGSFNVACGRDALLANTTGWFNVACGSAALQANTTGSENVAVGYALLANTVGAGNVAAGYVALYSNTTGGGNTAIGSSSLTRNTTGGGNIAIGYYAGFQRTTGDYNIDIGNTGKAAESNTIRIGDGAIQKNTFIAGISGATIAGGVGVFVDARGHLGTNTSSARFKEHIKPMDKSSEAILALEPVTFRYKKELDPDAIPQFGLVAEQVEKVNPDLVARDQEGKSYTVRYEAVNAMLLNEFLKEHRKNEKQETEIAELKAAVKAQAAQIQNVSDQLRTQIPATRVVANE